MDLLIRQLDVDQLDECDEDSSFSVINNACWSCGEIALQQGKRNRVHSCAKRKTDE
jgi:transportin-1